METSSFLTKLISLHFLDLATGRKLGLQYALCNSCTTMYFYIIFRESDITKERIQKILGAGANVVLVSGGIDDLCLKYFVEAGAMGVRRCKKADLKRIARATGGKKRTPLTAFAISYALFSLFPHSGLQL